MLDLYNTQYNRQALKANIYAVDFLDLLKTQKIDTSFAVRYILNKKYDLHDKYNITPELIIQFQPHIKMTNLCYELLKYDSDNDSIDDFETISKSTFLKNNEN